MTARPTPSEMLNNLMDAFAQDVLEMSDDQLRAEMIEDGEDPDAIADKMRSMIARKIDEHRTRVNSARLDDDALQRAIEAALAAAPKP